MRKGVPLGEYTGGLLHIGLAMSMVARGMHLQARTCVCTVLRPQFCAVCSGVVCEVFWVCRSCVCMVCFLWRLWDMSAVTSAKHICRCKAPCSRMECVACTWTLSVRFIWQHGTAGLLHDAGLHLMRLTKWKAATAAAGICCMQACVMELFKYLCGVYRAPAASAVKTCNNLILYCQAGLRW